MAEIRSWGHLTYLATEVAFIGSALAYIGLFHFPILWRHWRTLAVTTAVVVSYGSVLDAMAIHNGWGWFSSALTSGLWLGSLLFEEIFFWIGTAFVSAAAAIVMVEAIDIGIPGWALPVALMFPSWLWLTATRFASRGRIPPDLRGAGRPK